MPNGRSGGFPIDVADLKQLVSAITGDGRIGMVARSSSTERLQPADTAEVLRLVDICRLDPVPIEDQDRSAYVIHLSNTPILWVCVFSDSPLFPGLRERHDKWRAENPNWNGWIAF